MKSLYRTIGRGLTSLVYLSTVFCLSSTAFAKVWEVPASERLDHDAQEALLLAEPGDTVLLPAGRFAMEVELTINKPFVTLKGRGIDKTVLVYGENAAGPQAIVATADHSTVEDLTVRDHPGDGVKMISVNGATMRRLKVEWTKRASADNGAYGLYPVLSSNVLIEDCIVIGASDAGIYVGQSKGIIVRRNRAEYNVAGIEIENSQRADVYQNFASNNTGGLLIFNLPNLLVQGGRGTRVYRNTFIKNNGKNFAPKGNSVATVPQGTGLLVLANDDVEIFSNTIEDHNTTSIAIVNFNALGLPIKDPNFDAIPENVYIHDNVLKNAGRWPLLGGNELGIAAAALSFPHRIPHITYDGIGLVGADGIATPAVLEGDRRICLGPNEQDGGTESYFGNLNLWKSKWWSPLPGELDRSLAPFTCTLPRLASVQLEAEPPLPPSEARPDASEVARLCQTETEGVNWEALAVDCPLLSDYHLFQDLTDPFSTPAEGGFPYDLTTPLFSDYASKDRVLFLPPGSSATYQAADVLDLPIGTVVSKTFYFPLDLRQASSPRRLVETRLLIHREKGWQGLTYVWNGQEARLTRGGSVADIHWINVKGKSVSNAYRIPNLAQCSGCHLNNVPIGLKAGYLNRTGRGALAAENQLTYLAQAGRLQNLPTTMEEIPRYPAWNRPETGSLADRAKTYLDINCAHCHNRNGKANTSGLFLNIGEAETINFGFCKPPVAAGRGAGGTLFDIVPGKPQESILISRLDSTKAAIKMPELAKSMVHEEGVALVAEWIRSLQGKCEK